MKSQISPLKIKSYRSRAPSGYVPTANHVLHFSFESQATCFPLQANKSVVLFVCVADVVFTLTPDLHLDTAERFHKTKVMQTKYG